MATDASASHRVVRDTRLLLKTIRDEIADGRKPYSSDVRRLVDRALALKFGEYVQFLERNGYVTLDRKTDLLAVTRTGRALIEGNAARIRGVLADARHHFGDRIDALGGDVEAGGVRLDNRFVRLDQIGRGSLGHVWRGRNLNVDRFVAIKLLDGLEDVVRPSLVADVRRRFELAVRKHAQLVSPFVVQILDQNPSHTPPYVVMELATGGNLRDVLGQGRLEPAVAVRFFVQIAHGLGVAHAQGLVHGDLKPENVLLDTEGNIKLSDFGFSRVIDAGEAASGRAYVGFGSLGYMPPEMFRRRGPATPGADVYALGILLYEMLVGELPGRRSPMPSEVVEGLPKALDDLFDLMAQDDLRKRLGSVNEALELLWSADEIKALLLQRSVPLFIEPPVELQGLRVAPTVEPDLPPVQEEASESESENGADSFGSGQEIVTAINRTDAAPAVEKRARPRSRTTRSVQRQDSDDDDDENHGSIGDDAEFPRRRSTDNWGIPEDGDALDSDALDSDALDSDALDGDALDSDALDSDALDGDASDSDAPDSDAPDSDAPDSAASGSDLPGGDESDGEEPDGEETDGEETAASLGAMRKPIVHTLDTLASGMPAQVMSAPAEDIFNEGPEATGIEDRPLVESPAPALQRSGQRDENKRRKLEARLGKLDAGDA